MGIKIVDRRSYDPHSGKNFRPLLQTWQDLNVDAIFLAANMPQGPWHFPEDQVSDASERLLAAEVTREQLYRQLHQELPYASMVVPESYSLRRDGSAEIRQQIIVARESQRAIVLGKSGSRIKSIGEAARKELAVLLDCPVHLFLHVKVRENWDEDPEIYRDIGLDWVK